MLVSTVTGAISLGIGIGIQSNVHWEKNEGLECNRSFGKFSKKKLKGKMPNTPGQNQSEGSRPGTPRSGNRRRSGIPVRCNQSPKAEKPEVVTPTQPLRSKIPVKVPGLGCGDASSTSRVTTPQDDGRYEAASASTSYGTRRVLFTDPETNSILQGHQEEVRESLQEEISQTELQRIIQQERLRLDYEYDLKAKANRIRLERGDAESGRGQKDQVETKLQFQPSSKKGKKQVTFTPAPEVHSPATATTSTQEPLPLMENLSEDELDQDSFFDTIKPPPNFSETESDEIIFLDRDQEETESEAVNSKEVVELQLSEELYQRLKQGTARVKLVGSSCSFKDKEAHYEPEEEFSFPEIESSLSQARPPPVPFFAEEDDISSGTEEESRFVEDVEEEDLWTPRFEDTPPVPPKQEEDTAGREEEKLESPATEVITPTKMKEEVPKQEFRPTIEDCNEQEENLDLDKDNKPGSPIMTKKLIRVPSTLLFTKDPKQGYMKADLMLENPTALYYAYMLKCNSSAKEFLCVDRNMSVGLIPPFSSIKVPFALLDSFFLRGGEGDDRIVVLGMQHHNIMPHDNLRKFLQEVYLEGPHILERYVVTPLLSSKIGKEKIAEMMKNMDTLKLNANMNKEKLKTEEKKAKAKKPEETSTRIIFCVILFLLFFGVSCICAISTSSSSSRGSPALENSNNGEAAEGSVRDA